MQCCLLQSQNSIDKLLGALLENVVRNKPDKPVQWMIDVLCNSSSVQQAVQKASQAWGFSFVLYAYAIITTELRSCTGLQGGQQQTGMSPDRKTALLKVFSLFDKV